MPSVRRNIVLVFLLSTPSAFADGLTADEAARRASGTSFDVAVRRAEEAVQRAGIGQAIAGYVPKLSVGWRYTRLSEVPSTELGPVTIVQLENSYELSAQVSVPLSDYLLRVPHSVEAARSSARAARLTTAAADRQVQADARTAFYDWVRAR